MDIVSILIIQVNVCLERLVGIVCGDTDKALEELEDYLRENECDYADSILSYASTDSMGLQMILYFPRVK